MPTLRGRNERDVARIGRRSAVCLLAWALFAKAAFPLPGQDLGQKPAEAANPEDQISRGIVLDHEGRPAANVDVWLTRTESWIVPVDLLDHTRTDGAGRFQIKVPGRWFQSPVGARHDLAFIARTAESGLAAFAFNQFSLIPTEGIQLDLPKPSQTAIRVLSPEKQPVAGARLVIEYAGGPQVVTDLPEDQVQQEPDAFRTPNGMATRHATIALPAELQNLLSGTTAQDGTTVIKGISPEQVRSVRVTSEKFGTQVVTYVPDQPPRPGASWPGEITLSATATVRGKLTAKNPDWIKRRRFVISAFDYNTKPDDITRTSGMAEVTTDEAGRFEVVALSPGDLRFTAQVDVQSRSCISSRFDIKISAGTLQEIELPVVPVVRVRGLVQELDGGKPIANLGLIVSRLGGDTSVRTDSQGMYEIDLPEGQAWMSPLLQASLFPANDSDRNGVKFHVHEKHPKHGEFKPPQLKLRRAATIRGVVVDDAGRPVTGATVAGTWFGYSHRICQSISQDAAATTNRRGEFVLAGVDLRTELMLRARTASACTAQAMTLRSAPSEPVALRISATNMSRLKGRVIDSAGNPVADLPLELWTRGLLAAPGALSAYKQPGPSRRVAFSDGQKLRTDVKGEFLTPPLESDQQYRIELRAGGFRETSGDWVQLAAGTTLDVAELAVRRITEVRGVVRDSQKRPVADAAITFSEPTRRVETVTDGKGEFRLPDIADGQSFLFVRKAGWRLHGERYAPQGAGVIEVSLERPDEAPAAAFKIAQGQVPLADRRARAIKLLEQTLAAKDDENQERQEQQRMRTLQAWARIDTTAALARLEKQPFKEALFGEIIRNTAVKSLAVHDVDAALEIVDTMAPGYGRAQSLMEICESLPDGQRQRKLDLLADALVVFRAIKEPEMRLGGLAMIAERLIDLGESQRGEKLFREELDTVRQLGTAAFAGYVRGVYAEKFGVVDLPAALELIKDLKDSHEFNRHHGNLAHELAGKAPADAEKVLNLLKPPKELHFSDHDSYAVRVCYRMATIDLPRAERIAASIVDLSQRGYALGVMADALAAKDVKQGRDLLRRAYDVLDEADRDWKHGVGPHHPAIIAGSLLATARKLDTDGDRLPLLQECIWRTVALVPPATNDANKMWYAVEAGSSVALWLAEFDAPLARDVLLRVDARLAVSSRTYAPALALVASDRLDGFIEGIAESNRNTIRMSAATILPLDAAQLRRQIHHDTGVWPIDVEDVVW